MTARILLVDDVEGSRQLLQAKLTAEYYDVSTAADGLSALAMAADEPPDIILLDVIMPGMNGLQVCRKLKADETLKHIPVVLLTALDSREARLEGFRAGADEFLSKPIDDVFLFARLRSLARLKVMIDDLREREESSRRMGMSPMPGARLGASGGRILIVDDDPEEAGALAADLSAEHRPFIEADPEKALLTARGPIDLAVINIGCHGFDALRLVAGLVSRDYSRQAPILAVVDPRDRSRLLKALDLGVNDLLPKPFDPLELRVRAKALIRRKRYADYLRDTVVQSMEMAVTDPLTGLNNRRYMMGQLDALFEECKSGSEAISLLMLDIDQFKRVNDTWGHARGDQVLKEVAGRIAACVRTMDLPCRYGGDEFVVVMPATHLSDAAGVAERIRCAVSASPVMVEGQDIRVSVSVGVSTNEGEEDRPESLLRRADEALYEAKFSGRNQVMLRATKR
jgi:two-component system cell cycle response regulator